MKLSATGRILLWRGGSLWIGRGEAPTGFHAHHAVQIGLPLRQTGVKFQVPAEEWRRYDAAIVAAHQPHAFAAPGQLMAMIFVEPESRDGRELNQRACVHGISEVDTASLKSERAALLSAYNRRESDETLVSCARSAITKLAGSHSQPREPCDVRVRRALELIRIKLGKSISLRSIASAVHLSPDRFRHLFVEETGVGLRPYVLWLRLEIALGAYVGGSTLTEAAYAGGFADSAHFSRTFKKMFGFAPAGVRLE